ncbi:MAG: LysM peptidoglycan-binding domain-containing protein [Acidobacteriota bacterium]
MSIVVVISVLGTQISAGEYEVVPGDTLWSLAERCYDDGDQWLALARANPQLADPDLIPVGAMLQLPSDCALVQASAPADVAPEPTPAPEPTSALIAWTLQRVEGQRPPNPWQQAITGEKLDRGHAVRTFEKSAAGLAFFDDVDLTVGADSIVFLRDRQVRPRSRYGKVEIVDGALDVLAQVAEASTAAEVELLAKGAVAKVALDSSDAHLRSRVDEAGTTRFMAFEGATTVRGAESEVRLESGMGTVVAENGEPSAPEVLPTPPNLGVNAVRSDDGQAAELSWQPVVGAEGYRIAVCADRRCARPVSRGVTEEARWAASGLAAGSYFWQVRAISPSGLDGMPSNVATLEIAEPSAAPPEPASGSSFSPLWIGLLVSVLLLIFWIVRASRKGQR